MGRVWSLGVSLLVAGCGGALPRGMGEAHGGGTAGTTGAADPTDAAGTAGAAGMAGAAGTAGVAGTAGAAGSAGGGAAGSPYLGTTTWGDVVVLIAPQPLAAGNLIMSVLPETGAGRVFTYPSTTMWSPNDGAYVEVTFGCGGPAVDEVWLYSCAANGVLGRTATPGCIGVVFNQRGASGNFVDTDGTPCDIAGGSASFQIPPPVTTTAPGDPPPPHGAASGLFDLDCARGDGTHLRLQGTFVIPVGFRFLAC